LRAVGSFANPNTHSYFYSHRYSYSKPYADTDADAMHGEMCTYAQAASNSGASSIDPLICMLANAPRSKI